ncbi:hypothetical protein [Streptomyces sp. NPDC097619]|uniref:hypothetical protein n=1 Tax=Streptomyces sp. NPDC097619 TaxID=3157228 RepID=UPI00331E5EF0
MWRDESVTWQVAHRSSAEFFGLLARVDAVHGLHYLLVRGVLALWDGGPVALRLPSVAATALAAAGVALLGRELHSPRAGRTAGPVYALLPPVQMYAQEGRSYALVAAAVVWATLLLVRERWTGYAVVLALGCWLHVFAGLALLAHGCAAARRPGWRRAAAAVCCLTLPLALLGARQAGQQLGWLGRPGWTDWAAYATVATAGLLLARPSRSGRAPGPGGGSGAGGLVRVALPLLLLPPGLLLLVSLAHPWYVDRYVLYSLAGAALLVGSRPWRWWAALVAVVLLVLPWSWWLRTPAARKDDVFAVARAARELSRPGDAVLFLPARRREWLLSSPALYGSLDDLALARTPAASRTLQGTELGSAEIRAALLAAPRVLALADPPDQPPDPYPREAVKRQALAAHFDRCAVRPVHGAVVVLWARPGTCP